MKLLLIEDNPADARLVRELLKEAPNGAFELEHVTRLDLAAERLRQHPIDVVLLDLGLPDCQGMNTLMLAQEAMGLPIVVLTGLDDERFGLEAVRAGAQDYLIKGRFDSQLLVRTIRYAIERKRAEEALRKANEELEERVRQRTAELTGTNELLLTEMAKRARDQELLRSRAKHLEALVRERTGSLQEAVNELQHFSYTITHDMRAPLRTMRGYSEILLDDDVPVNPGQQKLLQLIVRSSERMDQLITDALNYTKLVQQEVELTPVEPDRLLREMIESYPGFQSPEVQISINAPLPPILGNTALLTQCFSNLLNNSVKFVHPGKTPTIRIWAETRLPETLQGSGAQPSAKHVQAVVRLWVEDQGIGIPADCSEKVFVMFERLSTKCEGTGIGLALVRKASERMGGKVGVESELGRGARFWLEFQPARVAETNIACVTEEPVHARSVSQGQSDAL